MKTTKNIARLAVTAGLAAALSFGGVMAPMAMAFAEAGDNSITIMQNNNNGATKFKAYQIFKATVTDTESGKTAQDITWVNEELGETVVSAIQSNWTGYNDLADDEKLSVSPTPQEVADFLVAHAGHTTAGSTSTDGTRIATGDILYAVANVVKDETPTASGITAGQPWNATAGSGYYLFVTDESSLGTDKGNAGTSPIFAVVGGSAVTVYEKTSIPTVEKKVLDDSKVTGGAITGVAEANWKDAADSQIGQEVNYRLTGTIADNYDSYDTYSYKFTDVLSSGLDYVDGSVEVYALNGTTYTKINGNKYSVTNADTSNNNTLTVEFKVGGGGKGLKGVAGVDANTQIVVFYKAKLNSSAVIAGANNQLNGNPNTVTLEYSNNPMSEGTGTSAPDTVEDYTYGLKINKVDLGTEKALNGAKFTITTNGDENGANLKYVTRDGTLSDSKVELSTEGDGVIQLTGLDAGVYTVTETSAPDGYTKVEPFTFAINPTMTADGPNAGLTELTGTLVSNNQDTKVIAGLTDKNAGDNKLTAKTDSEKVADGFFNITVGDTKQISLPLTGLNGVTFTWIAGGAVLCIGVAHLIRSRKRDEGSEE